MLSRNESWGVSCRAIGLKWAEQEQHAIIRIFDKLIINMRESLIGMGIIVFTHHVGHDVTN